MKYWLVKTEPSEFSIEDLKREKRTLWTAVRNYQARNFLREMKPDDSVLIYHSSDNPPGIVGVAKVSKAAIPDPTQFEKKGAYYEPKATKENPRWFSPELAFVKQLSERLTLDRLRSMRELSAMTLFQRGSRLSVMPVSAKEFQAILAEAEE